MCVDDNRKTFVSIPNVTFDIVFLLRQGIQRIRMDREDKELSGVNFNGDITWLGEK